MQLETAGVSQGEQPWQGHLDVQQPTGLCQQGALSPTCSAPLCCHECWVTPTSLLGLCDIEHFILELRVLLLNQKLIFSLALSPHSGLQLQPV